MAIPPLVGEKSGHVSSEGVKEKDYLFIEPHHGENMDVHIRLRYTLLLLLCLLFFIPHISRLVPLLKIFAAFVIFYFLPGVFLVKNVLNKGNFISSIFLAIMVGICFHIVYLYFLSFFHIHFNLFISVIPGVVSSLLADYYQIHLPENNHKEIYLVLAGAAFFFLTCSLSPGEDANGHLLYVNMILKENILPSAYTLYPEVPSSYHMGFHIIVSELEYVTETQLLRVMGSLFGVFMIFSSYLCMKTLHSERAGLVSGILVVFAVIPPLYYLSYGAYASVAAFAIQPLVIFLLYSKSHSSSDVIVLSLALAAGFMSHSAFLLFFLPLLIFLEDRTFLLSLFLSLGLSIPHLIRINPFYSLEEISQLYHLWYSLETFRVQMISERIGSLIFICGVLGLIFLKRKELTLFTVWLSSLALLASTSALDVKIPLWFVFFANRLVDFMALPLALLCSVFVAEIGKKKYYLLLLLLVLPLVPHFYSIPRSSDGPLFPTDSAAFVEDQEGILWLQKNTDESAIILNDWWTGTGSSWITSLGNRRVIFPFLYVHDHFIDVLSVPERSREVLKISLAPDTEESYHLLRAWGVDYIFLSSFVEDRVKWRRDSWDVQQMLDSPNYELVFKKNNTYIFKVKKEWTFTHLFTLGEVEIQNSILKKPSLKESFPTKKMIRITCEDSFTDVVQFFSDEGLVAEIPLSGTGNPLSLLLPFETVRIKAPQPLLIIACDLVTEFPGYKVGALVLPLNWVNPPYLIETEGHFYIFGARTLTITYRDTTPGSVDINALMDGIWKTLITIERTGDGLTKDVVVTLPDYIFLDVGIKVYNPPFEIVSVKVS